MLLSPEVENTCASVDSEMINILQQSGANPSHCQYHVSYVCCVLCPGSIMFLSYNLMSVASLVKR